MINKYSIVVEIYFLQHGILKTTLTTWISMLHFMVTMYLSVLYSLEKYQACA